MQIKQLGSVLFLTAFTFGSALVRGGVIDRCVDTGVLAITIDDGPAQFTSEAVDKLAGTGANVTFHFTTQYLTDPNVQFVIQKAAKAGHLIGLRSETTWDLKSMDTETIKSEFVRVSNVMAQFTGYAPKLVRLPYKSYDDRILAAIESAGFTVTTHNIDSYDVSAGSSSSVLNAYKLAISLKAAGTGSFISLQHDAIQGSMQALPDIVAFAKSKNYKLIRLDECVGLGNTTKNATEPVPVQGGGGPIANPPGSPTGGSNGNGSGGNNGGKTGTTTSTGGSQTNPPTSAAANDFNFSFIHSMVAVFIIFALALY